MRCQLPSVPGRRATTSSAFGARLPANCSGTRSGRSPACSTPIWKPASKIFKPPLDCRWPGWARNLGETAAYLEASPTLANGRTGPAVGWLQQALAGKDVAVSFTPYSGAIDGRSGPLTEAAVRALQTWAGVPVTGVVDDNTWFVWMTPGSAQQLTLENACGLLNKL
jgi:Putative peptidoglycan binding domain